MSKGTAPNTVGNIREQQQGADEPVVPARPREILDVAVDFFERVMPDLPMLGLAIVVFVLYLAAGGSNLGLSEDVSAAQHEAAEAAAAASGYVPF